MTRLETKYRQAAVVYLVFALIIVGLTVLRGGTPERKMEELRFIYPGLILIVVFAVGVYFRAGVAISDSTARRLRLNLNLAQLLAFTNIIRFLVFALNYAGVNVGFDFTQMRPSFGSSPFRFNFVMLTSAILNGFIAYMLVRAGWDLRGFRRQRR